jgi:hypothetical protein
MQAGRKAPDFRVPYQCGRRVTLSDLLLHGTIVLKFCCSEEPVISIREFELLSASHIEPSDRRLRW